MKGFIGKKLSPCKMKKSWNSPRKVLEFCFPISVRTLSYYYVSLVVGELSCR